MDQPIVSTENAVNVIHKWCFQEASGFDGTEQEIKEAKKELKQQKRLLEQEKQEFLRNKEYEEKRLEREKQLFDMKWKMLEEEWRKLVIEQERVERKKQFYTRMEEFEASERKNCSDFQVSEFFHGVKNKGTLKKRYKDLIKIFHPDNLAGDTLVIQKINAEYEKLKKNFEVAG